MHISLGSRTKKAPSFSPNAKFPFLFVNTRYCRYGDVQLKCRVGPVSQRFRWALWTVEIKLQKWTWCGLPYHSLTQTSGFNSARREFKDQWCCWKPRLLLMYVTGENAQLRSGLGREIGCSSAVEQHRSWISEGSFTISKLGGGESIHSDQAS